MEFPCKKCITLVMCKERLDKELLSFSKSYYDKNMGNDLQLWYAFNTMTRIINCNYIRNYIVYKFDASHDKEIRGTIQKFIIVEIKNAFKVY